MSADKPTGVIKGRVTYVETGAPAAGVPLQAQGRAGNTVYGTHRATTDEDGHYSLDGLRAAEYRVQLSTQHTIEWTTLGKKGIKLAAGETKDGVNLVLIKGGIICGKVVEAGTGEPVAGASVCASASGALHLATTGADGSFRLRCPPGAYMACPMWVPKGYSRPERLGWRPATVREGAEVEVRPFELTKGVTLVGRVVDPQGKPVSGVRVRVVKNGSPIMADTDAQGRFRLIDLLPNSRLTLRVATAGLVASPVVEVSDKPPEELEIKLLPFATLRGRVVDSEGKPVAGRKVRLVEVANGVGGTAKRRVTGEDGRYRFAAVPGTTVFISASTVGGWEPRSPTIVVAGGGERHVADIVVGPSSATTIAGRVMTPDGRPVRGARVKLRAGGLPLDTIADSHGRFTFEKVEPRGNRVWLVATNAEGTLAGQTIFPPGQVPGQLELRVTRAATVAGRVVDHTGEPIPGAQVGVFVQISKRSSAAVAHARTDAQGRYCIKGLVPHHRSRVMGYGRGYTGAHSKHRPLEAGRTLQVEDLMLATADSFIAGRVTDTDGKPLGGVRVSCPQDGGSAFTNSQGRFRIDGIPQADNLHVQVHHPGYHSDYRFRARAGSTDVDFTLTPENRLDPRAVATVGKPVPEPTVETWLNRTSLKLADLRGKVVLIHFWTLYSRPCLRSMHALIALHKQYRDDLAIVAIHDHATPVKQVREFLKENEIAFPVGVVKSTKEDGWAGQTFRTYRVKSLPAAFLVDRRGVLRHANVTGDLEQKLTALMAK